MDLGDIVSMGTELFNNKLGETAEGIDNSAIQDALSGLLSNEEGGFDLSNIMSSLTGDSEGGLASIVSSWIGGGENEAIDASGLTDLLGSDAIASFADKLGIDTDTAGKALLGATAVGIAAHAIRRGVKKHPKPEEE